MAKMHTPKICTRRNDKNLYNFRQEKICSCGQTSIVDNVLEELNSARSERRLEINSRGKNEYSVRSDGKMSSRAEPDNQNTKQASKGM
jgi:hypothetical protein